MAWYGHPKLKGSLLNAKYSLAETQFEQRLNSLLAGPGAAASDAESRNIGRVAPEPRDVLIGNAARAALNAAASAPAPSQANQPSTARPRSRRRPAAAAPIAAAPVVDPSDVVEVVSPQMEGVDPSDIIREAAGSRDSRGRSGTGKPVEGGFWGSMQRMIQAARSASTNKETEKSTTFRDSIGGNNPKLKQYLMSKKRDLLREEQGPKITEYLRRKKKDLNQLAGAESLPERLDTEASAAALDALLRPSSGQTRLPSELTGSLARGAGFVADGARAVGDGTRNFLNEAVRNFRNSD